MAAMGDLQGNRLITRPTALARRARDMLFRPARQVLPLYAPQRSGLNLAARRTTLLVTVVLTAAMYGLVVAILPPTLFMVLVAPLAILALLVIWALPEAPAIPLKFLLQCYVAFIVLAILWPNYLSVALGGLPWISVRRLLGLVTSFVLLICYSMSRDFRREISEIMRASPLLARFMLGFLIIQALSTFTSTSPGQTIGRYINLTLTITPFLFLTLWVVGTGRRSAIWFVYLLTGCMVALIMIGVLEFRAQHILWADHIPSFLKINDEAILRYLVPQFRDHYRVVTVFTTALSWGELIAIFTPFALHIIANSRTFAVLALAVIFDLALCVSAWMSGARLAMVGIVAAHGVYVLLWSIRRWRSDRSGLIGVTALMMYPAMFVLVISAIMFVPAVHNRVLGGGSTESSNNGRTEQLRLAIPAVAKRPLFGYGPSNGAAAVNWRSADGFLSIDSGFLSIAADYGILGFIAFYGMILLSALALAKDGVLQRVDGYPLQLALASSFVVLITTRLVLSQVDNDQIVFMFFGLAFALLYRSKRASAEQVG